MIPVKSDLKVKSTFGGNKYSMYVDEKNLAHIMAVMTDLYSDHVLAVIREYSTNAYDEHVSQNITRPIEISLPRPMRQTFEVRDFGRGLSEEEIIVTFGSYGESTKRGTNDTTGMLGLGSKSALTYTNMFTVKSVKGGIKTQVAIIRDPLVGASIEVIDTRVTDEPSGTTIVIPANSNNNFEDKAKEFFSVWPKGAVLIDGSQPERVTENEDGGFWINDRTYIKKREDYYYAPRTSYIVMGNVPYPVMDYEIGKTSSKYVVYHFAELGSVEFTPNREALNYTEHTRNYLKDIKESLTSSALISTVSNLIAKESTLEEAATVYSVYAPTLGIMHSYWNGVEISPQYTTYGARSWDSSRSRWSKQEILLLSMKKKYTFVDMMEKSMTPKLRLQIVKWAEDNNHDLEYVILYDYLQNRPNVMNDCPTVTREELLEIPVDSDKKNNNEVPKYVIYSKDTYGSETRAIDPTKDKRIVLGYSHPTEAELTYLDDGDIWVYVPDNRIQKFKRLYPNYILPKVLKEKYLKKFEKENRITELDTHIFGTPVGYNMYLTEKQLKKIKDKKLRELYALTSKERRDSYSKVLQYSRLCGNVESVNLLADYPLVNWNYPDHSIDYINMIYERGENK